MSVQYFRFFLPKSDLCREVRIAAHSEYGTVNLLVSNINPFPSFADNAAQWKVNTEKVGFAQSYVTLCPGTDATLQPGTYAIAVEAVTPSVYYLEISMSPYGTRPLQAPQNRANCSEIITSDIEYDVELFPGEITCLEDGATTLLAVEEGNEDRYMQLVLPVPAGCHTVSLTASPLSGLSQPDIYCLPIDDSKYATSENSLLSRRRDGPDSLLFVGCYEKEVTYVSCSIKSQKAGLVGVIWSSLADPIRTRLEDTVPGAIAMSQGLTAVQAVRVGENATSTVCDDYYYDCFSWVTYPLSDPLPYWPPPSKTYKADWIWHELPVTAAILGGIATVEARKLSIVVALQAGASKYFHSLEDYFSNGNIILLSITGETGLPPQLSPSPPPSTDGSLSFLPLLPASQTNFSSGNSAFCDVEQYDKILMQVERVVNLAVDDGLLLADTEPLTVNLVNYRGMKSVIGCLSATVSLMDVDMRMVILPLFSL